MFNLDNASIAGPAALALADMLLKGAVVFAAAGIVALAMTLRRASAAARHFIWLTAIVGSLAMPLFGLVLPTWTVRIPIAAHVQEPVLAMAEIPLAFADSSTASLPSAATSTEDSGVSAVAASIDQITAVRPTGTLELPKTDSTATLDGRLIFLVAWAVGLVIAFIPLIVGSLSLWRLRQASHPIMDERLLCLFEQLRRQIGVCRRVTLLTTDRRQIPMTWGLRRPILLLPADAATWPAEQLRAVLLHELAHMQRCDCLGQWIAQVARALHWCNPLAWLAVHQLRHEQERACDDQVLGSGLPAPDYADHLLAVASGRPQFRFTPSIAMAMARSPRIARRLRSILDPMRKRNTLSRRGALLAAAAALGLLVPLATVTTSFDARAQEAGSAKKDTAEKSASDRNSSADRIAKLRKMLADQYVTQPNDDRVLEGAIKGMVESLGDPFSEFIPAEKLADLERQIEGKLTGIGAQLEMRDGQLTVVTPLEGSPAQKAGLQPGDAILQIDDRPTRDLPLADAVKRILGAADTKVSLKMRRATGETADVAITRGPIVLRTVSGFARGKDQRWLFMLNGEHKIGYIAISQLGPRTADEIRQAVAGLKEAGLQGLILDLRFSPGGLLQAASDVAGLFLGEATVVTVRGRDGKEQVMKSDGKNQLGDFPLVVLAAKQTASASEVLAGALKDNNRAIVVGARTWGKGSVQTLIKLDDGAGAVRLTTAFFHSPSGRSIERKPGEGIWGVDPSDGYFVPMTQEATERLIELRKRREIIGGQPPVDAARADQLVTAEADFMRGDIQLAAAVRTLVAKVASGEFEKVGQSAAAALRRRELQDRRDALTKSLEELDREWKSLDQAK